MIKNISASLYTVLYVMLSQKTQNKFKKRTLFYYYKNKNFVRVTKSSHKTINAPNKGEKGAICLRSGSENDKAGQKHKGAIVPPPPPSTALQSYLCRWQNSKPKSIRR